MLFKHVLFELLTGKGVWKHIFYYFKHFCNFFFSLFIANGNLEYVKHVPNEIKQK